MKVADHSNSNKPDESFSYDANGNRTNSGSQTGSNNQLNSDGVYNYAYDDEGNLIRRTEIASNKVTEYQWDYRNRLAGVFDKDATGNPTQEVGFKYDAMNRRISKKVGSTETRFVYDRDNVLFDFAVSGANQPVLDKRYFYGTGVDQILAQESAQETVLWGLSDQVGTVKDWVNNSGSVANHVVYDAFGRIVSQSNAAFGSRYGFTGREFDAETGLYYYRARYYDATVGRFIGSDPSGFDGGDANLYRYVKNSPVDSTDPLGLFGWVRLQQRLIIYNDNGTQTATHIDEVRKARWENPNLWIITDVTYAYISYLFFKTGTDATKDPPDLIKGKDHRGHIVGAQLGGNGGEVNNLFSQHWRWNQFWKTYENDVRGYLDAKNLPFCPSVDLNYQVTLSYNEPKSLRPSTVQGQALYTDGHFNRSNIFLNPK